MKKALLALIFMFVCSGLRAEDRDHPLDITVTAVSVLKGNLRYKPKIAVLFGIDENGDMRAMNMNASGNITVGSPLVNNFDYFAMNAVTAATGVFLTSYNFLTLSAERQLTLDCTTCDSDIFFVLTESATPPSDTTTSGKRNILGAGTVRNIDNPGSYVHWFWDSGATITPSARYDWHSPALPGNSYD